MRRLTYKTKGIYTVKNTKGVFRTYNKELKQFVNNGN